jgi:hypothetical protein
MEPKVTFVPQLITGPKLDGSQSLGDVLKSFWKGRGVPLPKARTLQPKKDAPTENTGENEDSGTKETDPPTADGDNKPLTISPGVNMPLTTKKISVYLPISFGSTDTLTYDSPSLGSAGALLGSALEGANGGAGDILGNALGDFIDLFKGTSQTGANSLGKLGLAKLGKTWTYRSRGRSSCGITCNR